MKGLVLSLLFVTFFQVVFSQTVKILFDATKAQTSGNADWVIDADLHNIGWYPTAVVGNGNDSNGQNTPTPAQSGITATTAESFWNGGISNWGVDCVKQGYHVETLPASGQITYGSASNVYDLSNYTVYIVDEPNIKFTAAEKTALMNFVMNGGGLFMVADHTISDHNNDGFDSPDIWNDFITNNGVLNNGVGFTFDLVDISQTSSSINALASDSIIHGPMGNVTQVLWAGGTTMTLHPTQNASVKGVIYKSGTSSGNNNVLCAYAKVGQGKIGAIGDSSPTDDGTGDPNDVLYNGYTQDASGNHRRLIMNMTIWLASHAAPSIPIANFTSSNSTICAGQNVTYTNSSTGATSYAWTFVGGTPATSTATNPTITYSTPGNYSVSLVATNAAGTATHSSSVQVNDCTSGIEELKGIDVVVHPNPFSDVCALTIPASFIGKQFTIEDQSGKLFIQGIFTLENPSIDFSNQTPGEYYLRIDGMERVTKLLKH